MNNANRLNISDRDFVKMMMVEASRKEAEKCHCYLAIILLNKLSIATAMKNVAMDEIAKG